MTVESVANSLGLARSEVSENVDEDPRDIAQALGIARSEGVVVANLGEPVTVPGAPTSVAALAADEVTVNVSFSPPASDGGSDIYAYVVTSSPGNFTAEGVDSPIQVVADFLEATAYVFYVKAVNDIGESAAGGPSNQTLPNPGD